MKPISLPKTNFSLKQDKSIENQYLSKWNDLNLYQKTIDNSKPMWVLHDGPPYANGDIHIGHAVNKIFKDTIIRTKRKLGYNVEFIPGWDCHGLPIEWKIEEQIRKQGKSKNDIPYNEFIDKCRKSAEFWVEKQKSQFKQLGILADWDNPYLTMDKTIEANIFKEMTKYLDNNKLYCARKPVLWSVIEQTALADAEVEYQDKNSEDAFIVFELNNNESIVIWTTTPWTIPMNKAIAYNDEIEYVGIQVLQSYNNAFKENHTYFVAKNCLDNFVSITQIDEYKIINEINNNYFENKFVKHPLLSVGYTKQIPLLNAKFVKDTSGTGFVHIAPEHGEDDYQLALDYNLPIDNTLTPDGKYETIIPAFSGTHIFKANKIILKALKETNNLLVSNEFLHSYPHSWRSKSPLIYRATNQWFIDIEQDKEKLLKAIDKVEWHSDKYKNRISKMIETRPDWCVSRQRNWGVPLAIFVNKETNIPLNDKIVNEKIYNEIKNNGIESWKNNSKEFFLGSNYDANLYEKCEDVLEVWFDSGTTHSTVVKNRLGYFPADLYVEGSDQHRGWFQTSLLTSVGTTGIAPYKSVFTHGFILDEKGRKMSKSLNNGVEPFELTKEFGTDCLRLWVILSDLTDDIKVGKTVLKQTQEMFKKFRNTFRYLLGSLQNYEIQELNYNSLEFLDKTMLMKLAKLQKEFEQSSENHSYLHFYQKLYNFCANDLSSFYFDICKDSLYCDSENSIKRNNHLQTMFIILKNLLNWLSPVLVFTCEEVYDNLPNQLKPNYDSVHLWDSKEIDNNWNDEDLEIQLEKIIELKKIVNLQVEDLRNEKIISSSEQLNIIVTLPFEFNGDLQEIFKVSSVEVLFGELNIGITIIGNNKHKCVRCWKYTSDKEDKLCFRCENV